MYSKFFVSLGGIFLCVQAAFATPVTLLSEGFEGGLPSGAMISSPFSGDWVNVRHHDDVIDGAGDTLRYETFDNFFTEGHFAVLGDRLDDIGGSNFGVSSILLPFFIDASLNPSAINISYDWVFDTNARPEIFNGDDFWVSLVNGAGDVVSTVHNEDSPQQVPGVGFGSRGSFSATVDGALLVQPGDYGVLFTLNEQFGAYSSAVGLDNVDVVATVPEPGSALLLGAGLLGMRWVARRRLG